MTHTSQIPLDYLRLLKMRMPLWTKERGRNLLAQSEAIAAHEYVPEVTATPSDIRALQLDRDLWLQFIDVWQPRPYEGATEAIALLRALVQHDEDQ